MTQLDEREPSNITSTTGCEHAAFISNRIVIPQAAGQFDLTVRCLTPMVHWPGISNTTPTVFDATTIDRMQERFQVLLEGIVEKPEPVAGRSPAHDHRRSASGLEWPGTTRARPHRKPVPA
jgi:hypothetical protein